MGSEQATRTGERRDAWRWAATYDQEAALRETRGEREFLSRLMENARLCREAGKPEWYTTVEAMERE